MIALSVLICTYNRPELLGSALNSVAIAGSNLDVEIVVVNGGNELADKVINRFVGTTNCKVRLIKTKNINLATSRNIGLSECTGEIVAMTDDDAEVSPDWIRTILELHQQHPEAGAIGGMVIGTDPEKFINRIADVVTFPRWREEILVRTLPGVNISYKRKVLDQVGEQDTSLFRGEDVDFNWRVIRAGFPILFSPKLQVRHHHRATLRGLMHQQFMYGRAYFLVRKKWPDMYCVYPHKVSGFKSILKLLNFLASSIFVPLQLAFRMPSIMDKWASIPFFLLINNAWRFGVVIEMVNNKNANEYVIH